VVMQAPPTTPPHLLLFNGMFNRKQETLFFVELLEPWQSSNQFWNPFLPRECMKHSINYGNFQKGHVQNDFG